MRHLLAAVIVVIVAVVSARAQERLAESIEVRVVNVDVVVTDREGRPVTGLTKDDFEILENRQLQTITNFSEERGATASAPAAAAAAAEHRPRHFLLFIDSTAISPQMRKRILASVRSLVETHVRETDQASVISFNRTLRILAPLTSDRSAIFAALDEIEQLPAPTSVYSDLARVQRDCMRSYQLARSGRMPAAVAYADCINTTRIETMNTVLHSRQLVAAAHVALATTAGFEGKKVMLVAGAALPARPGLELYNWANATFAPLMSGFDAAVRMPTEEERAQKELLDKLARNANAHGVTLYLVTAASATDNVSASSKFDTPDNGANFMHQENTGAAFETLAARTGGVASKRAADVDQAFAALTRDLDSYYSLGYTPRTGSRDERNIVVRAKNRNYTVRARQTYAFKSADDEMSDRVVANIFVPAPAHDWKLSIATGKPEPAEKDQVKVPIEVTIPPAITLLPKGDHLAGAYSVYVAVGTPQGDLSTMFRQHESVLVPKNEEAIFRGEPLYFTATLTLRPGENLVSVGVLDQVGNTAAYARTTITTP